MLEKAREHFEISQNEDLPQEIFNRIYGKAKQKLLGITYTPLEIREELTNIVLKRLLKFKKASQIKIVDPCCGSGSFSITLIRELSHLGVNPIEALQKNIYLYDIDKLSVALAMVNISVYLKRAGVNPTKIKLNAKVIDFLSCDEKFDGFITNPPYVKLQNLDIATREYLKKKYPTLFTGALGLSAIFLKKMFDDLNDNGVIGVITQNNFFTSNSGVSLREEIKNHILKIDTFGSETIFKDVTAYTCLMYLTKDKQDAFGYRKINNRTRFKEKSSKIKNNLRMKPLKLGISNILRNETSITSKYKTTNYLDNIIAKHEAIKGKFDDVLFINTKNNICCSSTSNFFYREDKKIFTPPIQDGVLDGTIREILIAKRKVAVKSIKLNNLKNCKEVFITNSLFGIRPVEKIEKFNFNIGQETYDIDKFLSNLGM